MLRLTSLNLEALRGATQPFTLKFQSGQPITIIYGENGAGKSTICDALDLLGNAVVTSLDGKGLGPATSRYWHSTNRKPADIKIVLAATTGTWTVQVAKGKVLTTPPEGRPTVAILRRHQILNLIAGRPGDRYEAVRPFIAIDGIDDSERNLRDLINNVEQNLKVVDARIGENLQAIEGIWKQGGSPGPTMLAWTEGESKKDTASLDACIAIIKNYQKQHNTLSGRTKDWENALINVEAASETLSKAEATLSAELEKATAGDQELTQLLQAARHFFEHQGHPATCPLCGSREFAAGLPAAVEAKLNAMTSLRTAINTRDVARESRDKAASIAQTARKQAQSAASEFCATCMSKWQSDLPSVSALTEFGAQCCPESSDAAVNLDVIKRLLEVAAKLAEALDPELNRRSQRLLLLQTLKDALGQYRQNLEQKTSLDVLLPRLRKAHLALVEERRAFVDDILRRIATRVGELYEEVHTGEGLSKITILLDPDKRASLDIASQFLGAKDPTPPAAYLSESHLDTLGLCMFLALAELQDKDQTILVLDDVVASVDEPHVDRVIKMLYSESRRFAHCLMTTHYLPWREEFRWGWLKNGECQFVELGEWTLKDGIVTSKSTPRIDVLRNLMTEPKPEPQLVTSCAGVALEAVLLFLARQYECAVPLRRTKPTLGDLLPAIDKKLRMALRVEMHDLPVATGSAAPVVMLGNILDKLQDFAQLRNIMGCHFNELAFHLQDSKGVEFGSIVLALADALVHPDHGWPGSDKSGEYWINSGKSRRLFPLKRPS